MQFYQLQNSIRQSSSPNWMPIKLTFSGPWSIQYPPSMPNKFSWANIIYASDSILHTSSTSFWEPRLRFTHLNGVCSYILGKYQYRKQKIALSPLYNTTYIVRFKPNYTLLVRKFLAPIVCPRKANIGSFVHHHVCMLVRARIFATQKAGGECRFTPGRIGELTNKKHFYNIWYVHLEVRLSFCGQTDATK